MKRLAAAPLCFALAISAAGASDTTATLRTGGLTFLNSEIVKVR